ncbi:MAG TPA: ATP-binding protein [Mucilaginibacter sp.]|jgi:signal transduction histidine kinase|nr:ATP-binding protein [Mucilaginibacter sp.]
MRAFLKTLLILAVPLASFSQTRAVHSLRRNLKIAKTDSERFVALKGLVDQYIDVNVDTALLYIDEAISVAKKNQQWLDVAMESDWKANQLMYSRKLPQAYQVLQAAIILAEDPANERKTWVKNKGLTYRQYSLFVLANLYEDLGHLADHEGDGKEQLQTYRKARSIAIRSTDKTIQWWLDANIAQFYIEGKSPDSAMFYTNAAEALMTEAGERKHLGMIGLYKGAIYSQKGDPVRMLQFYHSAVDASLQTDLTTAADAYGRMANYFLSANQPDSGLFYSQKLLKVIRAEKLHNAEAGTYQLLYKSYLLKKNRDSAFKYLQLAYTALGSDAQLYIKSMADVQKLSSQDQLHLQQLEKEKEQSQTRARTYALSSAIGVFMLLAIIFYRNNRQKRKANRLLSEQKEEIETQRDSLSDALSELKAAQDQLVQREKMASLGELTAGIAHEIQNPLNFVNNFSEVNTEMFDELEEELKQGNISEAMQLAADMKQNEEKIRHHGKRADFIVKGMLEHSRTSTGEKQLTNLNVLAEEFLKLSYHGLRAKDKEFNADLVTHFDKQLPKVNIAQQDIGRVLINLFNNAFYAVNQKKKTVGADYKPEVSVCTMSENGSVVIKVKDNGNGIPDGIKDKIMQPFFTTKPTGEGTGLGLSLSYDIVAKGHGGSIDVDTKEGEFTEFTISIPA